MLVDGPLAVVHGDDNVEVVGEGLPHRVLLGAVIGLLDGAHELVKMLQGLQVVLSELLAACL